LKPVSKTAFYCCGVRMADAERRRPLCGDNYAKRFMDAEARAFYATFKAEKRPALANATRARIIDDYVRTAIGENPGLTILLIGAGFDSRAYRIHAGTWIELDEPPLIALKDEKLPIAECKNKLTRIAIDFASERLADKLRPLQTDGPCLIVLEGVLMYLEQSTIAEMLKTLSALFPHHTLICDLMLRAFAEKQSATMRERIQQLGAEVRTVDDPHAVFAQNHYRLAQRVSIAERALELMLPRFLGGLTRALPKEIVDGYTVVVFEPRAS
jgi:methyltransferase (TIGR00027 family)